MPRDSNNGVANRSSNSTTSNKQGVYRYDLLVCDGPNCSKKNPMYKCARCRSFYYCSDKCQEKHWLQDHHKTICVDYNEQASKLLEPVAPYAPPTPLNMDCGICHERLSGLHRPLVLRNCRHAFCFDCLYRREERVHGGKAAEAETVNSKKQYMCALCPPEKGSYHGAFAEVIAQVESATQSLSLADLPNDAKEKIFKHAESLVERLLASKYGSYADFGQTSKILTFLVSRYCDLVLAKLPYSDGVDFAKHQDLPSSSVEVTRIRKAYDMMDNRQVKFVTQLINADEYDAVINGYYKEIKALALFEMAKLEMAMSKWKKATNLLDEIDFAAKFPPDWESLQPQLLATASECYRQQGNLEKALKYAQQLVKADRQMAGVHKYLARTYEAMGELESARTTMCMAILYEEPWNEVNKSENIRLLAQLSPEAVAERKREESFLSVFQKVLDLAKTRVSDPEESWISLKAQYDMHGAAEEEEEDAEVSAAQRETSDKLGIAAARAVSGQFDEEDAMENGAKSVPGSWSASGPVDNEAVTTDPKPAADVAGSIEEEEDVFEDALEEIVDETGMDVTKTYILQKDVKYTPSTFSNILLTKEVNKWLRQGDPKFIDFFIRRVTQLAAGDRSRILAKRLMGCKKTIYETYLEQKSGTRILWTERKDQVLIWYVARHDRVSRLLREIDKAETRGSRRLTSAAGLTQLQDIETDEGVDRIILDPMSDTPLKLYYVHIDEVSKFKSATWRPPLYLTKQEKDIVENRQGTVLLLGRSGTGKTVCICTRIDYDRHMAEGNPSFSQLFVARSKRICRYVQETVGDDGRISGRLDYYAFDKLKEVLEDNLPGANLRFRDNTNRVDFPRFKKDFPALIKSSGLDPLVVWTQIRSSIKGSIDAVMKGRPLTLDEYLDYNVIGSRRCRLTIEQRKLAYEAFMVYQKYQEELGLWDDCDRINVLLGLMDNNSELTYSRIYVDEIQDYTQAEIAVFYKLVRGGHVFFAGDPAQSVVEGVEFRFDEVRSVAYHLLPKDLHARYMPDKPEKVTVNFRSHSGILNVAAAVLDRLFVGFKDSAPDLRSKDAGVFNGPRPGVFLNIGREALLDVVQKIEGVVLLAMNDDDVRELAALVPKGVVVLSIRDSKGLEFPDVILVDFFCRLSEAHQRPWRELLQGVEGQELAGFQEKYPEIETHLKQLYTAITRCSMRFFVSETKNSVAGKAFERWVTKKDLAVKQSVGAIKGIVKTPDEWRSTGIDYAINAESSDQTDRAEFWLDKAAACFERGEAKDLETKVRVHAESIRFRSDPRAGNESEREQFQKRAAKLLESLLDAGLKMEATKVCSVLLPHLDDYSRTRIQESLLPLLPELE